MKQVLAQARNTTYVKKGRLPPMRKKRGEPQYEQEDEYVYEKSHEE